ncbi:Six-hairpin glycosidase-like protein [Zychaea mexicana]|uniref:Six-hairpin glycosidase-like protein n=1 Tax=Zychaea mexicana TaxID=64656 RepID=UPI0022FEF5DA|nr:Six-hairpin glycosidase-like protein [Zychaea mexicana]KAI9497865.1 Six-hairpin glycosidase-like protein [Zychaea mexicana]
MSSSNESARYAADARKQPVGLEDKAGDQWHKDMESTHCNVRTRGYLPIENYGIIGNLHTVALCGTDGSIDFCCYPEFDSPSIFARMLDKDKGGHFAIAPDSHVSNKQQYMPKSNVLATRFLSDEGVAEVIDYMHRPERNQRLSSKPLLPWIIRRVRIVRGSVKLKMECYPAFNYAQDSHTTEMLPVRPLSAEGRPNMKHYPEDEDNFITCQDRVQFESSKLSMDLRYIIKTGEMPTPKLKLIIDEESHAHGHKGPGVYAHFEMHEGQEAFFIFREVPKSTVEGVHNVHDPPLTLSLMAALFRQTLRYWQKWIDQIIYRGRWRENVMRSAMVLKLLTYEPTGAVVAAPTFGIPEAIGGARNWDYRYLWVRDSAFTIYAFLRLGFTEEASKFMQFVEERCNDLNPDGSLNIMYSIRGEKYLEEVELNHLDGYRSSRPVRVGNGAYDHLQLDIYGELLDGIYLYNKYGAPVSYDMWCAVRKLVNFVCDNYAQPDMSIWEVRGKKQNFTYSRVMCWVAVDRGLRLADKRMFPCPDRDKWLKVRDEIYEEIQTKCWNPKLKMFTQSIESPEAVDASCLIMPLVFFSSPVDPRMLSTIERILRPPEKGGLVANNLVFRYNFLTTDDGLGGLEGAFSMCTFWLVEAMARAGKYDKKYLQKAVLMFEEMVSYSNHLGLFSEEVARSGELLGNVPQAFSHLAFISASFNLDRVLGSSSS